MQRFVLAKRAWLVFFLLALAAYLYGLGNFPFVGPDEPRYAQVAREMLARGDMVTPTLAGQNWFEKPALPYWTMMASYKLFGVGEGSARLSFALMGLLTVCALYYLASRTERTGSAQGELHWLSLSCAVVGASSAGLLLFSHGVNFDIPLTLTTTVALACFFAQEVEEDTARRRWLLSGFYSGAGASLLAKGLIGFIITFGVVTLYYLLRRAWPRREIFLSLAWGVPLALLVAATWYAPVIYRHGWAFVDEFFIQHHFARYTSNKYHHPQPFYFYLPVLLLMLLPWTPYLIESAVTARRWRLREASALNKWRAFGLAWLLMPVLFFSVSGSKLPGYILPALPGAVMLVGERLARTLRGEGGSASIRACGVLLILLAVGLGFYVKREGYPVMVCAAAAALPLVAAGLLALVLAKRRWLATVSIMCSMFLVIIVGLECGIEKISRRVSIAHALSQASARGYGSAPVYNLHTIERTAEFYAAGRLQYGADGEPLRFEGATQAEEAARTSSSGAVLVIVPSEYASQLTTYPPLETEVVDDNGDVALIAVKIRKADSNRDGQDEQDKE
ncbi:MAG TPA: glycosyltransferase family 39 protein [Pyrinomonadaceae bacterium]|nr:glycosyltransferase family 39 protein [Pyrinomonadaceae bacterium]